MGSARSPVLSVVVAIVSDSIDGTTSATHVEGTLAALHAQADPPPMEILVPYHSGVAGIEELRRKYPDVRFIHTPALRLFKAGGREHHNELRAIGIRAARGEYVALIEDHGRPDLHWCNRMAALQQASPAAAIGGAIENGIPSALNYAVYLCDFARYMNPIPRGEASFASDANVCLRRGALDKVAHIWQEVFEEPEVIEALRAHGEIVSLAPEPVVRQMRENLTAGSAVRERFIWGRSYAAGLSQSASAVTRLVRAVRSILVPPLLIARIMATVLSKGRSIGAFARSMPYLLLLATSWGMGEMAGHLTARPRKPERKKVPLDFGDEAVRLTVGVIAVGGPLSLRRCLDSLVPQAERASAQVIVPYDSTSSDLAVLSDRYPQAHFLDLGTLDTTAAPGSSAARFELYARWMSAVVRTASGNVVAFLQDFGIPDPDWCDRVIEAHRSSHAIVGGAVAHAGRGNLNWAVFFLDFGRFAPPFDEGLAKQLTDVNVSYKKAALEAARGLYKDQFTESLVNHALSRQGFILWQNPTIVVRQDRGELSFRSLIDERLQWGRLFGAARAKPMPAPERLILAALSPLTPPLLWLRTAAKVFRDRRHITEFLKASPALLALACCWTIGELQGTLLGESGKGGVSVEGTADTVKPVTKR